VSRFAVFALILCLGACSSPPAEEETASLQELEAAAGPVAGPPQVLPNDIATLRIEQSAALGPVVADRDHYTLYFDEKDGTNPPSSVCVEADCTLVWSPLLAAGGKFDAPDIDPALLKTFMRPDGLEQVTIGGHPVYRYVDDENPGDTTGQGVDGRFAIAPNGSKAAR
jgi:predicted lipoprotein with Yx(FWY)xxD motif